MYFYCNKKGFFFLFFIFPFPIYIYFALNVLHCIMKVLFFLFLQSHFTSTAQNFMLGITVQHLAKNFSLLSRANCNDKSEREELVLHEKHKLVNKECFSPGNWISCSANNAHAYVNSPIFASWNELRFFICFVLPNITIAMVLLFHFTYHLMRNFIFFFSFN